MSSTQIIPGGQPIMSEQFGAQRPDSLHVITTSTSSIAGQSSSDMQLTVQRDDGSPPGMYGYMTQVTDPKEYGLQSDTLLQEP